MEPLIDRVRNALNEATYPRASLMEPGYLLDEQDTGAVRLRWGYVGDGVFDVLQEPNDWVKTCTDYLLTWGFDVQPGDWVMGDGGAIYIVG